MITNNSNTRAKIPIVPNYNRLAEVGGKHYSSEDNRKVYLAILSSVRFMERYENPERSELMVDTSRYLQGITTDEPITDENVEQIRQTNIKTKVGELITCPMCGRKVTKTPSRIYCSKNCSTWYHRKYG